MAVEIPEAGAVTHIEVSLGAVAEFYGTCAARLEPAPPSESESWISNAEPISAQEVHRKCRGGEGERKRGDPLNQL